MINMSAIIETVEYNDGEGIVKIFYGVNFDRGLEGGRLIYSKKLSSKAKQHEFIESKSHMLQVYNLNLDLLGRSSLGSDGKMYVPNDLNISSSLSFYQEDYPILANQEEMQKYLDRLKQLRLPLDDLELEIETFLSQHDEEIFRPFLLSADEE